MLYHLLYPLHTDIQLFNVFRYITFRTAAASVTALALSLVLGPMLIRRLRDFQIGQVIRQEGPQSHRAKAGTPTMGGLLILASAIIPTLLWADLKNAYIWVAVLATLAFGAVGLWDDYLKIVRRSHHGLLPRYKMGLQIIIGIGVGLAVMALAANNLYNTRLIFPFFKNLIPDLGWFYVAFAVLVLVGATNAVNLTDGLDGLAAGCCAIVFLTYTVMTFITPGEHDLALLSASLVGGCVGFLWFNSFPASVFMGDTGSLGLGGAIAALAVMTKTELLLIVIGGIFVIEALSVAIQVIAFQRFRRRVFLMAPIHHHFELAGWSETKIILRFWIVAAICAAIGFTLYQASIPGQ
jgi:phospho-N-acetylmuramoyl-pentapeptide-transferase